jgi:hypothetical protein
VTNQSSIHDEVKSRLNPGNACYYSVQSFISRLPSKTLKIKINKTIILPVVPYECETWSVTLTECYRLQAAEENIWT